MPSGRLRKAMFIFHNTAYTAMHLYPLESFPKDSIAIGIAVKTVNSYFLLYR